MKKYILEFNEEQQHWHHNIGQHKINTNGWRQISEPLTHEELSIFHDFIDDLEIQLDAYHREQESFDEPKTPIVTVEQIKARYENFKDFRKKYSIVNPYTVDIVASGYFHGHKINCHNNYKEHKTEWKYEDGTLVDENNPRLCPKCKKLPDDNGHDACFGKLPGVKNACCGHGVEDAYIHFENDTIIRFKLFTVEK